MNRNSADAFRQNTQYNAGIAGGNNHPLAYICCGIAGNIAVVDLITLRHVLDIPCGEESYPYYIVIDPAGEFAYVSDYVRKLVMVVDLRVNRIVYTAPVAGYPKGLALSPCGRFLYAVFADTPVLQALSAPALEPLWETTLPGFGSSIAVANGGLRAYVTLPDLNQCAVVDLCSQEITQLLDTDLHPSRVAAFPNVIEFLVACTESASLVPVDTCGPCVKNRIPLDAQPSGLAYINQKLRCLVALPDVNLAAVVDVRKAQVVRYVAVGDHPGGVAASEQWPLAVVGNQGESSVSVINTNTNTYAVAATVPVGRGPVGVAVTDFSFV